MEQVRGFFSYFNSTPETGEKLDIPEVIEFTKCFMDSFGSWNDELTELLAVSLKNIEVQKSFNYLITEAHGFTETLDNLSETQMISLLESLQLSREQLVTALGGSASEIVPSLTTLIDLMTLNSTPLRRSLSEFLKNPKEAEELLTFEEASDLELLYISEGFKKEASNQPYWTKVSVSAELDHPVLELSVAKPGVYEKTLQIPVPIDSHPELEDVDQSMILEYIGRYLDGTLSEFKHDFLTHEQRSAVNIISEDINEKIDRHLPTLISQAAYGAKIEDPAICDKFQERKDLIKKESFQILEEFYPSLEHLNLMDKETRIEIERLIKELDDLEFLIRFKPFLEQVILHGLAVGQNIKEGIPVTIETPGVAETSALANELAIYAQEHNVVDLDSLRLIMKLQSSLITAFLKDETDLLVYRLSNLSQDSVEAIQEQKSSIEKVNRQMSEFLDLAETKRRLVGNSFDLRELKTFDLVRLNELKEKLISVVDSEELKEEINHCLSTIERIKNERIRSIYSNHPDLIEFKNLFIESFSLQPEDADIIDSLLFGNQEPVEAEDFGRLTPKEALVLFFETLVKTRDQISSSLEETGSLPSNFYTEISPRFMKIYRSIIGATFINFNVLSAEEMKRANQLGVHLAQQVLFINTQHFTDSGKTCGLDLATFKQVYKFDPTAREAKYFIPSAHGLLAEDPEKQKDIIAQIGYWNSFDSYDEKTTYFARADWECEEYGGEPPEFFIKGICHLGRYNQKEGDRFIRPLCERSVRLDLSKIGVDTKEKSAFYFNALIPNVTYAKDYNQAIGIVLKESLKSKYQIKLRQMLRENPDLDFDSELEDIIESLQASVEDEEDIFDSPFWHEDIRNIAEHAFDFSRHVEEAMYKIHYSAMNPELKIKGVSKRELLPAEGTKTWNLRSISKGIISFDKLIDRITHYVDLTDEEKDIFKQIYFAETAPVNTRSEFGYRYPNEILELMVEEIGSSCEAIKTSLQEFGHLPDNFYTKMVGYHDAVVKLANELFIFSMENNIIDSSMWDKMNKLFVHLNNRFIFNITQHFTDTSLTHGLDKENYEKIYKKIRGRVTKYFIPQSLGLFPDNLDLQEKLIHTIGHYFSFDFYQPNDKFFAKADWSDVTLGGPEGKEYFVKGTCHIGRVNFHPESEKNRLSPACEMDVKLDLSDLNLDSQKKVDDYFGLVASTSQMRSRKVIHDKVIEELEKKGYSESDMFKIASHLYKFSRIVEAAMYKVHYAALFPKLKLVKKIDIDLNEFI